MCLALILSQFFAPVLGFLTQPGKEEALQPGPACLALQALGTRKPHHPIWLSPAAAMDEPRPPQGWRQTGSSTFCLSVSDSVSEAPKSWSPATPPALGAPEGRVMAGHSRARLTSWPDPTQHLDDPASEWPPHLDSTDHRNAPLCT